MELYNIFALLRCYVTWTGSQPQTFRYNMSAPSSRVNIGLICCPETSVITCHYCVTSQKSEDLICTVTGTLDHTSGARMLSLHG